MEIIICKDGGLFKSVHAFLDFNVDNYDIDELIQLLDFDKMPTNGDMVVNKIKEIYAA